MLDDLQVTVLAKEPTLTNWVWTAGFVDGEGCIAVVRSFVPKRDRYVYGVQVVATNRDREVLDWMRTTWGGWVVPSSAPTGRARVSWNWRAPTGISAQPFLTGIRPWLRLKGPQCGNALAMIEVLRRSRRTLGREFLPQAWLDEQEKLYWIQRQLNHRGSDEFVARPMHSPRKINRERAKSATVEVDRDNVAG
ncbi:MAG TPA: hypothetical protein VNU19_06170 [Candidatus Acidoferrum sp.]|nr:hypothetical protein [Candidatus Acidoferrum sp.]